MPEHRSNLIDGGSYWVCHVCHKPLPNGTSPNEEIWSNGNIFCSEGCLIFNMLKSEPLCTRCGKNHASEPHPCPFQEEINNDPTSCTCCDECTQECINEI